MENNTDSAASKGVEGVAPNRTRKSAKDKLFPVFLLKNYRPIGRDFKIEEIDADGAKIIRDPLPEEREKVRAGATVHLSAEEARELVSVRKVAERADDFV